jgi:hypothetical protein
LQTTPQQSLCSQLQPQVQFVPILVVAMPAFGVNFAQGIQPIVLQLPTDFGGSANLTF